MRPCQRTNQHLGQAGRSGAEGFAAVPRDDHVAVAVELEARWEAGDSSDERTSRPDVGTQITMAMSREIGKMRVALIAATVALLALTAMTLLPAASAFHTDLSIASTAVAGVLLVLIIIGRAGKAEREQPILKAAKPATIPTAHQADAEVVSFLAIFQERGRFIDFLMDDITAYSDAQVGAAARIVHEGCRSALNEHFRICPVREESEGSPVSVPAGYAAEEYRLVGNITGEAPFSGTLVHRGWKTEWVKLPRLLRVDGDRLPTIAPAEVELS